MQNAKLPHSVALHSQGSNLNAERGVRNGLRYVTLRSQGKFLMQNAKCRMQNYLIPLYSTHTEKYKKALSLSLDRPRFLDEIRRKGKQFPTGLY